jgi:Mg-chelatase subunit ChlD
MNERALVIGSLGHVAKREGLSIAESFLNCDVLLLVDMSGSMSAKDAPGGVSRFDAAETELRRLQESLPGKVAVVAFSDDVQFCPSGVPPRLAEGTNLARALHFVRAVDGLARIIVISDGRPNDEAKALAEARQFKSRIDTVYIGPDDDRDGGHAFLKSLAMRTGGEATASHAPGLLAESVQRLLLRA